MRRRKSFMRTHLCGKLEKRLRVISYPNIRFSVYGVFPLYVMDATSFQMFHLPVLTRPEKCVRITGCSLSRTGRLKKLHTIRHKKVSMEVACSYNNMPASTLESGGHKFPLEEELILKNRSQQILPYLNERCIYVVGMMGSGKTTVGKIMSQALSYSFCDCDTLIEEKVDGNSVADIFKLYGESFFRDKETEALNKLSLMHKLVISTGGGAVVRPINWKYMHKGVSVWLDVPVEALAKRIAAVGTNSRPLLHDEAGDAYTAALMRLSALFEERGEFYANANARVSLENIATKLGRKDASDLSPTVIAIEALEQIGNFLKAEDDGYAR